MILSNMFRGHDCGMLEASERAMHGKEVSTAGLLEGVARACLRSIGLASINRAKAAGKAAFRSLTEMGPLVHLKKNNHNMRYVFVVRQITSQLSVPRKKK